MYDRARPPSGVGPGLRMRRTGICASGLVDTLRGIPSVLKGSAANVAGADLFARHRLRSMWPVCVRGCATGGMGCLYDRVEAEAGTGATAR